VIDLVFSTPRSLPKPGNLRGRVVVLDIAFAADGMGTPFEETTLAFIRALGPRLVAWVDHHDHDRQKDFAGDSRFTLARKVDHGACPEMVTPSVVNNAGPVDTIVTHVDLDGLYAAAKWLLDGREPYQGADDDARAVDTRLGQPGPIGTLVDKALRARLRDDALKHRIVRWLAGGKLMSEPTMVAELREAAGEFDALMAETQRLAGTVEMRGRLAYVDASGTRAKYDKTELLLLLQTKAAVAAVRDAGSVTVAAAFDSGLDFVQLFGLGGGMPTRVSLPEKRLPEVFEKLK
jgi:hypothetical protein